MTITSSIQLITSPNPAEFARRVDLAQREYDNEERAMMGRLGQRMAQLSRSEAPKRTGRYAQSISHRVFTDIVGSGFEIRSNSPLRAYITEGTKPHPIVARRAKFLRFFWPKVGRVVFFKSVNHPGTRPNRFYNRAVARWMPEAKSDIMSAPRRWAVVLQSGR